MLLFNSSQQAVSPSYEFGTLLNSLPTFAFYLGGPSKVWVVLWHAQP